MKSVTDRHGEYMLKKQEIYNMFQSRIVTGSFTKKDQTKRKFWGILKNETRDNEDLITVYDFRKNNYRRFRLNQGSITLKSGNKFFKYN